MKKKNGRSSFGNPAVCAVVGCGEMVEHGSIYCHTHRHAPRKRASLVDAETTGPTPESELDITTQGLRVRLAGKEVHAGPPCIFADCAQPTLRGRLYCSSRCRSRARKSPPLITIDGLTMTFPEHVERVGLDLGTVYCRIRAGDSFEEAITRPLDDEMQRRRLSA